MTRARGARLHPRPLVLKPESCERDILSGAAMVSEAILGALPAG